MMFRHFVHAPGMTGKTYTMLTSTFAHQTPLHILFNTVAFWSFGTIALMSSQFARASPFSASEHERQLRASRSERLPGESSLTPHFLAFYCTAGTFAALVSHLVLVVRFRRAIMTSPARLYPNAHNNAQLSEKLLKIGSHASLGASGAVYAMIAMTACAVPDTRVQLIFLPFFSFPLAYGVAGAVAFDVAGVLFKFARFDPWAHLG